MHLGLEDHDPHEARAMLGEDAIIGVTCHTSLERARSLAGNPADYVAFGRFFPSPKARFVTSRSTPSSFQPLVGS